MSRAEERARRLEEIRATISSVGNGRMILPTIPTLTAICEELIAEIDRRNASIAEANANRKRNREAALARKAAGWEKVRAAFRFLKERHATAIAALESVVAQEQAEAEALRQENRALREELWHARLDADARTRRLMRHD